MAAILGATGEDALAALPGEEADTPTDRPNHVFIHPGIFTQASGPKPMRSKQLAWALIMQGADQERAKTAEEQENVVFS